MQGCRAAIRWQSCRVAIMQSCSAANAPGTISALRPAMTPWMLSCYDHAHLDAHLLRSINDQVPALSVLTSAICAAHHA
jgi:hypothetical protein